MDRKTPLLTLALFALGAPALASDIDEVASYDLSQSIEAPKADGEQLQNRSGKGGHSSAKKGNGHNSRGHAAAPPRSSAQRPGTYSGRPQAAHPSNAPNRNNRPGPDAYHHGPGKSVVHRGNTTVAHRPGTTVVHRPGQTTVHHGPGAGRPVVTHRPPVVHHRPPVVHHRPVVAHRPVVLHRPVVRYTHVRPYHGIFVYGPRPVTHVRYVDSGPGPVEVQQTDLPSRAIDRTNAIALGAKAGSMVSSNADGLVYGDPGFGLTGRYRPAETVGFELGVGHHSSAFVDPLQDRSQTQVDGSVELFAFPWTRVSPYALGGLTWNSANFSTEVASGNGFDVVTQTDAQLGLHGGLGVEFALGNNFALDLEGRYIGWLDERYEGEAPGAIQATAGLQFYFK